MAKRGREGHAAYISPRDALQHCTVSQLLLFWVDAQQCQALQQLLHKVCLGDPFGCHILTLSPQLTTHRNVSRKFAGEP